MDYADKLDMMDDDCDIQGYPIDDCGPLITNADHIRAMGDEELAEFLCEFRSCDANGHPCDLCKAELYCSTGHTGTIDWLRQPWEEDV